MNNLVSFDVIKPGNIEIHEDIRSTFRNRMEKLYIGWDDCYDKQFDNHSFLFVLKDNTVNEYVGTCRLIFKRSCKNVYLTPMEIADKSNFSLANEIGLDVCEAGMLSFKSMEALRALMKGLGLWILENKIRQVYTTYDINNQLTKRFYLKTLCYSVVEQTIIEFSNFKAKKDNSIVKWQVVKLNVLDKAEEIRKNLKIDSFTYYNFEYEYGKYYKLVEWQNAE